MFGWGKDTTAVLAWQDMSASLGGKETGGVRHPGCFVQRVRKDMKRLEIVVLAVQKSA